jgi:hypothetical protein
MRARPSLGLPDFRPQSAQAPLAARNNRDKAAQRAGAGSDSDDQEPVMYVWRLGDTAAAAAQGVTAGWMDGGTGRRIRSDAREGWGGEGVWSGGGDGGGSVAAAGPRVLPPSPAPSPQPYPNPSPFSSSPPVQLPPCRALPLRCRRSVAGRPAAVSRAGGCSSFHRRARGRDAAAAAAAAAVGIRPAGRGFTSWRSGC